MEDNNALTPEFLCELYNCAFNNDYMCSIIYQHMDDSYLPDRQYQTLNSSLKSFYKEHKAAPKSTLVRQMMAGSRAVLQLLDEIQETAVGAEPDAIRKQFENYLKQQYFKKVFRSIKDKFDNGNPTAAIEEFQNKAKDMTKFSLEPDSFIDVAGTFETRLRENKVKREDFTAEKPVTRFYIDELDEKNKNRNLRTQLTLWLAMSGVGKSHLARWIGMNGAYYDGLNVLHIQLEGSTSEILDAYSASLIKSETFQYEMGELSSHAIETFRKNMKLYQGTLKVKSYPKFGKEISTIDVKNTCDEYKREYGYYPDIIIIDSLDLLTDSSGRNYDSKSIRFKRIAVAKDLKDLAADMNCWINATYQATIEDPNWANNEKNILTGYHLSEAKGLQRPCTHVISLNRSSNEEKEQTMRLYVDKSRFFAKGSPFRIATDYDHEQFYDRERTLNLPKDS